MKSILNLINLSEFQLGSLNILFLFPIVWKLLVFDIFIHKEHLQKQLYHVFIYRNTVVGSASRVDDIET